MRGSRAGQPSNREINGSSRLPDKREVAMHRITIGVITCWALIGLFGPTAHAEKADTVTRMLVELFMDTLKAQDLERVMKTVDVPWVHKDGVIKERPELKQYFKQLLAGWDFSRMTYEVKQLKYDDSRGEYLVRLKVNKGGADEFILRVRYRGGDVKLVGLLWTEPPKESSTPADDAVKKERADMAGTWKLAAYEVNGNK